MVKVCEPETLTTVVLTSTVLLVVTGVTVTATTDTDEGLVVEAFSDVIEGACDEDGCVLDATCVKVENVVVVRITSDPAVVVEMSCVL